MGGIGTLMGGEKSRCPVIPIRCAMRLSRVGESAWLHVQQAGVQSLYQRQLVRGKVYAVDGSGLGDDFRLVALVCVSATRPIIVAWRLLSGQASEKGQEAAVTRQLVEQVVQAAGPQSISLLLADALYADGPRFSWLKYGKGIDAQVELARGSSALPRPCLAWPMGNSLTGPTTIAMCAPSVATSSYVKWR
jgi:hypothetical protein